MNPCSISLCVHQHFAGQFLRLNEGAIRLLHQQIPCELVVGGNGQEPGPIKDVPVRAFSAPQAGYNQAKLAAMRHASGALGMWCDASDVLQLQGILQAVAALQQQPEISAVVGGMGSAAEGFARDLAPSGLLMRREAAIRFVRVHEYGLVGNFETIAQLRNAGALAFHRDPLSTKQRVPTIANWRFNVQNAFFEVSRPERYVAHFQLYDIITLERHLADAEHFLLFWDQGADSKQRSSRMFAKRAALYLAAAQQAVVDAEATMALHYFIRALAAGSATDRNFSRSVAIEADLLLPKAQAEQIAYLAETLAADRILVEDHASTRALAKYLSSDAMSWHKRSRLAGLARPSDLLVFARTRHCVAFARHMTRRARFAVSLEQLKHWMASPLEGLMRYEGASLDTPFSRTARRFRALLERVWTGAGV